ncbi:alpha-E domain-containing protein [Devosia algicola]|uniref:Alpha-E domain-containing protein n=1 Tax=Devosia algicola TaxID=3026418 RepID=A0ABY7YMM5_9HYPH|nr:alpha-E domain-containing protein [Devosia algicola]WDR02413.1 alpha-E domain-containing protein [Devosia algicola]
MIEETLAGLTKMYGVKQECHEAAARLSAMVAGNTMDKIFADGLHDFLTEFLARNYRVTETLSDSYNFY